MKSLTCILLIFMCFSVGFAQYQNVNLIANVNDYPDVGYSDCWGYAAPNGDEYALLGVNNGVSIVNVTDLNNIAEVVFIPYVAAPPHGWYDIKTYQHYMYVSTEGSDSIIIVDLSTLPDSASIVASLSGLTSNPHNIFIDTEMGILYVAEDFHYDPAVRIFSLADPLHPVELSSIGTANIGTDSHDVFAQDSVLYVAEGNNPSIGIFDVSDPVNPFLLTRLNIPTAGYVHQVWVSEDNMYMITTEETPGKTIKIWDIQNLDNISLISENLGGSQLVHNAYFDGDLVYTAHYESGLKILDFSDPTDVKEVGFYDTYPQSESPRFNGAWGVYPFTQNGRIFVSDMQTGLYVLQFERDQGPQIAASPLLIDLGIETMGNASAPLTVTIKNLGTENLTISDISDPGASFILSGVPTLPLVLPPLESATFEVTFLAMDPGIKTSAITITSNDADDPVFDLLLSGTSVDLVPTQAKPGVIYATTGRLGNNPGSLITVDLATGAGTLVGHTGLTNAPGLAIDSKGDIYCTSGVPDVGLYRIDAANGAAVLVDSIDAPRLDGIAFDENDVLYGLGYYLYSGLYTIDITTGRLTRKGWTYEMMRGMAFDPTDGTLWASSGGSEYAKVPDGIYTINITNGDTTLIGTTGLGGSTSDIFFDEQGNLYGVKGGGQKPNNLISIDKATGVGTVIGPIGFKAVSGLAIRPPISEGAHIALTPKNIKFNRTEVDSSDTVTVFIRNVGTESLNVSSISKSGAPFSFKDLSTLPLQIPPDRYEYFEVIFSPINPGDTTGTISITSDDADNSTIDLTLVGESYEVSLAESGVCYASTGKNGGGILLSIDLSTGVGKVVRPIRPTVLPGVPGLAINSDGQIFGSDGSDLFRINAMTGEALLVGNTGLANLDALTFDGNDVLYGIDASSPDYSLYIIDTKTGATTLIGSTGDYFVGLAYDSTDSTLWAATGENAVDPDAIHKINPRTGVATKVGTTGLGGTTADIIFDHEGNLFGIKGGAQSTGVLISINKTSGEGTGVGSIGFRDVSGLTIAPGEIQTIVDQLAAINVPEVFALYQNFPNPFNPVTSIKYSLKESAKVTLKIYNVLGHLVKTLVNEKQTAGVKKVVWNGTNENGTQVANGVYIYKIEANDFVQSRKMLFLK